MKSIKARYLPLGSLLKEADIITLHTPLTPATNHLISSRELDIIKPSAFLINTARGGIIDTEALIETLLTNKLAGAALDVFPNEPSVPEALMKMDQVVLTPHTGTGTWEDRELMFAEAWMNIVHFLKQSGPVSRVN